MKMFPVILASKSPRRSELLRQIGIPFTVIVSDVEEVITREIPSEVVMELSEQKAAAVAAQMEESCIVLGADTVVAVGGEILGKPADEDAAAEMLRKLSGKDHEVYTGVTLIRKEEEKKECHTFAVCTRVTFFPMSEEEIRQYVASGDPMDKAGAYGIQGPAAAYIKEIHGDYNNVVGLPVSAVYQKLKELNWF